MLTEKQKELLLFIHARMQDEGVPPSFDEMKDALDLKSKSGIHRLITALVERGFIRRLPHRARAIEVIKLPENQCRAPRRARTAASSLSVIEGAARPRAAAAAVDGHRQPHRIGAAHGPDRRRRADQRHPEPLPRHRLSARPARPAASTTRSR